MRQPFRWLRAESWEYRLEVCCYAESTEPILPIVTASCAARLVESPQGRELSVTRTLFICVPVSGVWTLRIEGLPQMRGPRNPVK